MTRPKPERGDRRAYVAGWIVLVVLAALFLYGVFRDPWGMPLSPLHHIYDFIKDH